MSTTIIVSVPSTDPRNIYYIFANAPTIKLCGIWWMASCLSLVGYCRHFSSARAFTPWMSELVARPASAGLSLFSAKSARTLGYARRHQPRTAGDFLHCAGICSSTALDTPATDCVPKVHLQVFHEHCEVVLLVHELFEINSPRPAAVEIRWFHRAFGFSFQPETAISCSIRCMSFLTSAISIRMSPIFTSMSLLTDWILLRTSPNFFVRLFFQFAYLFFTSRAKLAMLFSCASNCWWISSLCSLNLASMASKWSIICWFCWSSFWSEAQLLLVELLRKLLCQVQLLIQALHHFLHWLRLQTRTIYEWSWLIVNFGSVETGSLLLPDEGVGTCACWGSSRRLDIKWYQMVILEGSVEVFLGDDPISESNCCGNEVFGWKTRSSVHYLFLPTVHFLFFSQLYTVYTLLEINFLIAFQHFKNRLDTRCRSGWPTATMIPVFFI